MNWLTSRMVELSSFGSFYENAQSFGATSMRLLPFGYIEDVLSGIGVRMNFGPDIETSGFHLYTEDYSSPGARPDLAPLASISTPIADPLLWFTTVLDDGQGTNLYLPDDDIDDQNIQFFTRDRQQRTGRVYLTGELSPASARLTDIRQQDTRPGECRDGYCNERVGNACGVRCHCRELPDAARRVRLRLTPRRRSSGAPIQVSVVKCTRDR